MLGRIANWTLRLATVGVLVGVYQFETNDIGEYRGSVACFRQVHREKLTRIASLQV